MNKVILMGRLTRDPEVRYSQGENASAVARYSLAVDRRFKRDGEPTADFINCVAWRQTAEFICKFFKKGNSICISGSVQTRTWNDQQNNKRYATEIIADEAFFVDGKSDNAASEQGAPTFTASQANFEEVAGDDDLPF